MSTLHESIDLLERLKSKADEWQRRYEIELLAYRDVSRNMRPGRLHKTDRERDWYTDAYAEAELKRDYQPEPKE